MRKAKIKKQSYKFVHHTPAEKLVRRHNNRKNSPSALRRKIAREKLQPKKVTA
jgi:hypothetical protein